MRLIEQSFTVEDLGAENGLEILRKIERAGRVCYKSEDKITDDSAAGFVHRILMSGHHSVIEHHSVTARIITNRGVTHEIVRHRLASYSQESSRYCDYGGDEIIFIRPVWPFEGRNEVFVQYLKAAEEAYKTLRAMGWTPQQAREVLPNALKTEIVMTTNLREWRHFFTLRCSSAAHPQMRDLALRGLLLMARAIPVVFDDLAEQHFGEAF